MKIIEIHGTGTSNKGAELMAIAILEHYEDKIKNGEVKLVAAAPFGPFSTRARYNLEITDDFPGRYIPRIAAAIVKYFPARFKQSFGIIGCEEVDCVLDASGFAFGDHWGVMRSNRLLNRMTKQKRAKQTLILLPQAFGSFSKNKVRQSCEKLFARAQLICARDATSKSMIEPLVPKKLVRQYPDFTALVRPKENDSLILPEQFVAICPNIKMLNTPDEGAAYLKSLNHCVKSLQEKGIKIIYVLHESTADRRVLALLDRNDYNITIIDHPDPRVLKWVLGKSLFVIGSRFHALVSALSQNIPCLGMGWSHKYEELFSDFDHSQNLHDVNQELKPLEILLSSLLSPDGNQEMRKNLARKNEELKKVIMHMWQEIDHLVFS